MSCMDINPLSITVKLLHIYKGIWTEGALQIDAENTQLSSEAVNQIVHNMLY